mgnify:CR=1 FL=1
MWQFGRRVLNRTTRVREWWKALRQPAPVSSRKVVFSSPLSRLGFRLGEQESNYEERQARQRSSAVVSSAECQQTTRVPADYCAGQQTTAQAKTESLLHPAQVQLLLSSSTQLPEFSLHPAQLFPKTHCPSSSVRSRSPKVSKSREQLGVAIQQRRAYKQA